jgi:tetratricopeptide (TPR) repeat protein
MGDHFSGPRVYGDPAADIADLYAFPSPELPGHVVLALTVFPGATVTSLFSDAITYRFRIRPVTIAGPAYAVGEDEHTFDFTFTDSPAQTGTCSLPGGEQVSFQVGDVTLAEPSGVRIFAGARLDPFFLDLPGVRETRGLGRLAFRPKSEAANTIEGANILSIVLDLDAGLASAVVNLDAQIDGLAAASPLLIDLLILRGQVLGRIADYERAAELAEQFVRDTTGDGTAFLSRARARATFHRFTEALADLDAAERSGLDRRTLAAERAVILQATGCYGQARELLRSSADFSALGALAVFHASRCEAAEAERLFGAARRSYRGTSPFPVASLDFRRGLMWYTQGNLEAARTWFDASVRRVPAYAPALGHLVQIEAALGAQAFAGHAADFVTPEQESYETHRG